MSNMRKKEENSNHSLSPFMFLYLRLHSVPTLHTYGLNLLSLSTSLSFSTSGSRGAKLHCPWLRWYLSPFCCLYDLLQPGLGHRNGLLVCAAPEEEVEAVEEGGCGGTRNDVEAPKLEAG